MASSNMSRQRRELLKVESMSRPGFRSVPGHVPKAGDRVYCADGEAEVVQVLSKLSDGGRLLELRLDDRPKPSFFAASSNVLVRDEEA